MGPCLSSCCITPFLCAFSPVQTWSKQVEAYLFRVAVISSVMWFPYSQLLRVSSFKLFVMFYLSTYSLLVLLTDFHLSFPKKIKLTALNCEVIDYLMLFLLARLHVLLSLNPISFCSLFYDDKWSCLSFQCHVSESFTADSFLLFILPLFPWTLLNSPDFFQFGFSFTNLLVFK